MLKTILISLLPLFTFFSDGSDKQPAKPAQSGPVRNAETLEKMIVANGTATLQLDLRRLNGTRSASKGKGTTPLRFQLVNDSFFTILVLNDQLRGPQPGSVGLIPMDSAVLPAKLDASFRQLVVESYSWGGPFDLVVRDSQNGFVFFNIEGYQYDFDPTERTFSIQMGRLVLSKEFAAELGRPQDAGTSMGQIDVSAAMRPIQITQMVDGQVTSDVLPAERDPEAGTVPGPDVIVGDLSGLAQFGGSSGTQVGLAVGTDSCNAGTVDLNWFASPDNDHPVIPQNLYRMSGGPSNDERFEQIGQSSVKHAFTALTNNLCGFGCNGVGGSRLGSGCSDPYSASLNAGPNLGSRSWINPFTGSYPRGDSATPPNNHSGHTHSGPSHRVLTEINDLNTTLNAGATYYAEAQYVTPHEYNWCQANPSQCNMYNNVSYRKYNVIGTGSPFSFSPAAPTVRSKTAISAWPGATFVNIQPDPGNDGIGTIAYKVTSPSTGVWRYEYAIYNQNMDRAIQSFSVPVGPGTSLTNVGFHMPPQHPAWSGDGTVGSGGLSSAPWVTSQANGVFTWNTETFAQNPNANAIRWGTLYNFRFDSNRPPQTAGATIGFFKTGAPITVQIAVPSSASVAVSVSGRVVNAAGQGLKNAKVLITDGNGATRLAVTSSFGYYRFDNVASGASYTIAVRAKIFTFTPRTVQVNDNLANVDFSPVP